MIEERLIAGYPAPTIGDDIYVGSAMYIDHGEDDVVGGLAEVDSVKVSISAGRPTYFVTVVEHPGHSYNWAGPAEASPNGFEGCFRSATCVCRPDGAQPVPNVSPALAGTAKLPNTIITISATLGRIACRLCAGAARSEVAAGH